jgi:hypothetical protein
MKILSKLFGSEAKVKIMRLFMFNPEQIFSPDDISARAKVPKATVKHEIYILRRMGMVKGRRFVGNVSTRKGRIFVTKKKSVGGFVLNESFPYLPALRTLLIHTVLFNQNDVLRRLSAVGRMKLVIVAGVFTNDADSRADLLIVGDNIKFTALANVIKGIESEIGKELRYVAFETGDFKYRFDMYDKLIRDILDYPHKKILSKLGDELQVG